MDAHATTTFQTAKEKPEKHPFRSALSRDKPDSLFRSPEQSFGRHPRPADTSDMFRRTIPPLPQDTLFDDGGYCTWSELKKKKGKHRRRRKIHTDSESSDTEDDRDSLNDTLATPHPKNFLHGTLAKKLRKPDPTPSQLHEYRLLKGTKEWRDTKYAFIKWINTNKELRFAGTPSVAHFVEWNRTMRTHFKDCDIHNAICQFEVATTTFTRNARSWWDAHCVKCPGLLVTYEQLLEWIRHELVPDSNPALAYMEWNTLKYRGNVDEYMKQIERLMEYFPIQRDTMIACLAKPISSEFAAELRNMDIRLEGMSNPKLKEVIRNHLISTRHYPTYRPANHDRSHSRFDPDRRHYPSTLARHDLSLHAATKDPVPRPQTPPHNNKDSRPPPKPFPQLPADPTHTYVAAKYGEGPTPCYVCGDKNHGWVQCTKKKRGKCGVCGSEAHWTRYCRQRYRPSPQARLNYQAICLEALSNPEIQLVNAPFDHYDSDVEGYAQQQSEGGETGSDSEQDRKSAETPPGVSLCQVSLTLPQKFCHCSLKPSEEMQSAVKLLGSDVMERWQHFLRKICIDATSSIFPVSSPTLRGQLLYRIEVEHSSVIALLDHGASHSFMSKEWAIRNRVPMKPLSYPFTYSFFNGTHDVISHIAYPKSVRIGPYNRPWTFFVVARSPCAVVIGLDAIRGWPLFYSPLDDRLVVVEDVCYDSMP